MPGSDTAGRDTDAASKPEGDPGCTRQRVVDRQALNRRWWKLRWQSCLLDARRHLIDIRTASNDEDRWFYAVMAADYRQMAHDAAVEAGIAPARS